MATGRIRRSARRGIAAAMLGWLGIVGGAVLLAPSASAAPAVTVEIRTVTPPAASVDAGGTVTFINKVDSYSTGANLGALGSFGATVNTDVSVTFFGQRRDLQVNQSAAWAFSAPATTGQITYTYRIVPAAGTPAALVNQVVSTVAAGLPALPAPTPYVVQTIAPNLPTLPTVNLPQLPTVNLPPGGAPPAPVPPVDGPPTEEGPGGGGGGGGGSDIVGGATGSGYTYGSTAGTPQMSPSDVAAAAAFDPSRYYVPGRSLGSADRAGSGGVAGGYDGASVPVFGQLAGLDGSSLDEESSEEASASPAVAQTLPAAALAAVIALAAVTATLIRTHQAARSSR